MTPKETRIQVVRDNRKIFSKMNIEKSTHYSEATLKNQHKKLPNRAHNGLVHITSKTAIQAALDITREDSIGILNFASAKNPGGGYIKGSLAQEESLCLSSTLYPTFEKSRMHQLNKKDPRPFYHETAEVSYVHIIRDSQYTVLDEPVFAAIFSMPMVNLSHANNKDLTKDQRMEIYERRIGYMFETFNVEDVESIVVGAWGTGVFRNDPQEMAQAFKSQLKKHQQNFKKIIFAIPPDNVLEIFVKEILA